jgi:hypothetical protein
MLGEGQGEEEGKGKGEISIVDDRGHEAGAGDQGDGVASNQREEGRNFDETGLSHTSGEVLRMAAEAREKSQEFLMSVGRGGEEEKEEEEEEQESKISQEGADPPVADPPVAAGEVPGGEVPGKVDVQASEGGEKQGVVEARADRPQVEGEDPAADSHRRDYLQAHAPTISSSPSSQYIAPSPPASRQRKRPSTARARLERSKHTSSSHSPNRDIIQRFNIGDMVDIRGLVVHREVSECAPSIPKPCTHACGRCFCALLTHQMDSTARSVSLSVLSSFTANACA